LGAAIVCGTTPACCQSLEAGLRLRQSHDVLGDNILTVAPSGVRLENVGHFKFVLVAKAPDWRVTIYRIDDKLYFAMSLTEFEENGLMSGFLIGYKPRSLDSHQFLARKMTYLNYQIIRMTSSEGSLKYLPLGNYASGPVERIIYMTYKVPTCGGIPLDWSFVQGRDWVSHTSNGGHLEAYLTTSEIDPVKVSPAIFTPPKYYQRAKSLREVVSGSDVSKKTEDALEILGARGKSSPGRGAAK